MNFEKRYAKLNIEQKKAVDTIDGPVMVIAGPGTGKTELLGVRVANILKKTDTLPENILCLTFTESGANAMRERLIDIIGKDAYKVSIHTFHSFGSEIINQYGQYFYQGASFRPAEQLNKYEILQDIFKQLNHDSPVASTQNGEFTYLNDTATVISELKRSGLTSDELLRILDENDAVIEKTEQLLSPIFESRISKSTVSEVAKHIATIRSSNNGTILPMITPLSDVIADSLQVAIDQSLEINKTTPLTQWRKKWFEKDSNNKDILKSRSRQNKLRIASFIYDQYLANMLEAKLYDFDDMILRIVHAMEIFDDLRFNLQEKYQYIMVDEFQDTNMAQMRILHNLTNNEVQGDTPNILVVGDDDQAIYSFQGADISNILDFRKNYPRAVQITLTENYRSTADILDKSRKVIIQGSERLENIIEDVNKQLNANNGDMGDNVHIYQAESIADERLWIVNDIKNKIKSGTKPSDIAVFTRRHHEIESLLPYFYHAEVAVNYERNDNVLEIESIKFIKELSQLLIDLMDGHHDKVNAKLPEILAHKSWGIAPIDLWQLSLSAYKQGRHWLDIMADEPKFGKIHNWLINTAFTSADTPLEQMLDIIIGKPNQDNNDEFTSPIYEYYFSKDKLKTSPNEYLLHLEAMRTIRSKLREYKPNEIPTLKTFIDFIDVNQKIDNPINSVRPSYEIENAVNVMTAHKSKGLEFNLVYITNAVDNVWGEKVRSRNRLIGYPENLPLSPAGETIDERLRLFYVAMTRAKKELNITYSLTGENGKNSLRASFLLDNAQNIINIPKHEDLENLLESSELAWYKPLVDPVDANMRDLLIPMLKNYKLSVTHLQNFLNIKKGGPEIFLLNNLLRFPSAKSPSASFGTAIHDTLKDAHDYLVNTGKRQAIEDIVSNFEVHLKTQHLSPNDFNKLLKKGSDNLHLFLDKKYSTFNQKQQTELDFGRQHCIINDAHLSGKLDLIDSDKSSKKISVTDYKTSKPSNNWAGKDDHEKTKLHQYRQQLMFYKLLVENARDWRGYIVESGKMQFIEPDKRGEIISLDIEFSDNELAQFKKLINAVWLHIKDFNLPDISEYEKSHKGILKFEQDLIDNNI